MVILQQDRCRSIRIFAVDSEPTSGTGLVRRVRCPVLAIVHCPGGSLAPTRLIQTEDRVARRSLPCTAHTAGTDASCMVAIHSARAVPRRRSKPLMPRASEFLIPRRVYLVFWGDGKLRQTKIKQNNQSMHSMHQDAFKLWESRSFHERGTSPRTNDTCEERV